MRCGSTSRIAAHDLLREAGARRIDDHDVGLAGLLGERAHGGAHVAGEEARVVDAVQPRVRDRVRDGLLDHLDAPHLTGLQRQRERDRADPAEQVEHLLATGEPGEVARHPVEHLGHLGVGLEEGLGGDPEPQAVAAECAAPRRSCPCRRPPRSCPRGWSRRPTRPASRARRGRPRRRRTSRSRSRPCWSRFGLELAAAASLAHDEVAQEAGL